MATMPFRTVCFLFFFFFKQLYCSTVSPCSLVFEESASTTFAKNLDWVSSYPEGDATIVFLSHDNMKRNAGGPPTLLAHSSVPYGIKSLQQGVTDETVEAEMVEAVRLLLM